MNIRRALFGLAFSLGFLASNGAATDLHGRIVITRKITKKRVTPPIYQLRGVSTVREPDDADAPNELKEVVVFLESDSSSPDKPAQAELRQHNRRFEPQLLVIPAGSTVSFPNSDPVFHNVFSLSKAKKFDLGYYPAGQTRIVKLDAPGIVQVYCHLHPNMYAAIVVVPNCWYAQPADDGTFSLMDVPPGTHHLAAWHMNAGFFRQEVDVPATGAVDVLVRMPVHDKENGR
jgi:plastocyanin